jgi:hypothetical protein
MLTRIRFFHRVTNTFCAPACGLCCALILSGCGEQPKREVDAPVAKAPAVETAGSAKSREKKTEAYEATVAGYRYVVPPDWEEIPPTRQFVLGEFTIPGDGGPARLTLSSAGGGMEANLDRWRGQFSRGPGDPEPQTSEVTFDGQKGTLVELAGLFSDGFSREQNKDWRMLGVAIPIGDTNYFIKLTGPASTVTPRREEFLKFVESAKQAK